jgi:hypothetical protein
MAAADALAAFLRAPSQESAAPLDPEAGHLLREHGLGPLVYRALQERQLLDVQPAGFRSELARLGREEALIEPFRRDEVTRVIDALTLAGVQPLLFKWTELAYTCYPDPSLRPRLDTDLLIRQDDVEKASRVFGRLGFTPGLRTSGEHVTHQAIYISPRHGLEIAFDVHWKLSDPQAFADLFSYEELERDARLVAALGPAARALCDEHALLVACMHRVAHHFDQEILIYLYDIALLGRRLGPHAWDRVVAMATAKGICQVTSRGLDLSSGLFGLEVPPRVSQELQRSSTNEPTAAYLADGFRKVDILRANLRALGWRDRFKLLREHLFPSPAFVLRSAGQTSPLLLPALYVIRVVRGAGAWFRPLR